MGRLIFTVKKTFNSVGGFLLKNIMSRNALEVRYTLGFMVDAHSKT